MAYKRLFNVYRSGNIFEAQVLAWDADNALHMHLGSRYAELQAVYTACGIK